MHGYPGALLDYVMDPHQDVDHIVMVNYSQHKSKSNTLY